MVIEIVTFPMKNGEFFHSYGNLPEGSLIWESQSKWELFEGWSNKKCHWITFTYCSIRFECSVKIPVPWFEYRKIFDVHRHWAVVGIFTNKTWKLDLCWAKYALENGKRRWFYLSAVYWPWDWDLKINSGCLSRKLDSSRQGILTNRSCEGQVNIVEGEIKLHSDWLKMWTNDYSWSPATVKLKLFAKYVIWTLNTGESVVIRPLNIDHLGMMCSVLALKFDSPTLWVQWYDSMYYMLYCYTM